MLSGLSPIDGVRLAPAAHARVSQVIGALALVLVSTSCTYSHYEDPEVKAYKAALHRWEASPHLYRGYVLLKSEGWSPEQIDVVRGCERPVLPITHAHRDKVSAHFRFTSTESTAGRVASCLADVPGYDKAGTDLLSSPPPVR
jgi:hypothetical protein